MNQPRPKKGGKGTVTAEQQRVYDPNITDAEKIAALEAYYKACWGCIQASAWHHCKHLAERREDMRLIDVRPYIQTVVAISKAGTGGKPDSVSPIEVRLLEAFWDAGLDPVQQYGIDRYVVDFAFPRSRLVVEADGHDYHQDADRERERDETIRRAGWHIVHFTGSQIHENAEGCVATVYRLARSSLV